jgi:transposase-like protein
MTAIQNLIHGSTTPTSLPRSFTPGDVGRQLWAGFLDEDFCRQWILTAIHGDGEITCPGCQAPLTNIALCRFWDGRRICCRACGKYFTALTKTFLAGCHMDFREVILLAIFLHFGIPAREIARILKISSETVRLWEIKFQAVGRIRTMSEVSLGQDKEVR